MEMIPLALLAGILTILAPCVFALLPVIIGGSISGGVNYRRALTIIGALTTAVIVFTLLLKASTILIDIDPMVWKFISGVIIILLGFFNLYPEIWSQLTTSIGFTNKSSSFMQSASQHKGLWGDILTGFALGPVFTSCSPTYAVIITIILPQDFLTGLINLIFYALGLSLALLSIALLGQVVVAKFKWAVDPDGWFKKLLGIIFILVGLAIIMGIDKKIETAVLDAGYYDTINIENKLLDKQGY